MTADIDELRRLRRARDQMDREYAQPLDVPALARTARGVAAYIGDGSNRWPAVHRLDAARLFRLALEEAPAGSVLHAVADEGVPTRTIAEVIGRHLDLPVASIEPGEAEAHFGWMGLFFGSDASATSVLTRELLGWQPTQPGLVEDLDQGHYFDERPPTLLMDHEAVGS